MQTALFTQAEMLTEKYNVDEIIWPDDSSTCWHVNNHDCLLNIKWFDILIIITIIFLALSRGSKYCLCEILFENKHTNNEKQTPNHNRTKQQQ
jgi:hypothetical protein